MAGSFDMRWHEAISFHCLRSFRKLWYHSIYISSSTSIVQIIFDLYIFGLRRSWYTMRQHSHSPPSPVQCASIIQETERERNKKLFYFDWSPPRHFKTAMLTPPLLCICRVRVVRFYVSPISSSSFLLFFLRLYCDHLPRAYVKFFNGNLHCQAHAP